MKPEQRTTTSNRNTRWPGGLACACLWVLHCAAAPVPDALGRGERVADDLPVFLFAAKDAGPEFGGQWGLWPQQEQCRGKATFLPDQDAEGGSGGAMRLEYDIRGEPQSLSLWTTPGTDTVDLSSYDRFVIMAKGSVPSFTLVVKDRNAADPAAPDGIADRQVKGLTGDWQQFDVPFLSFVPRKEGAAVDWRTINHVAIALIAPGDNPQGTLFVDNLRASHAVRPLSLAPPATQNLAIPEPTAASGQGWKDDFDGATLTTRWEWRVPVAGPTLSLTEHPGWLRLQLPERAAGFNHWNEPELVDEAPQLRAAAPDGDWQLETHLTLQQFAATNHFQIGLVVGMSDDFLVDFGPFQGPTLPGGPKTPEVWLEPTGLSGFCRTPGDALDLRLRVSRTGCLLHAQTSRDGSNWVEAGSYLVGGAPRFVGLVGKTFSAGPPVIADVDYVRLTPLPGPKASDHRALVGIGGDYPTGYRGLLARLGLPHEVLLDYQLGDIDVLRRFDLLLIGSMNGGTANRARDVLMRYVREGGTALLDGSATPPSSVVPGKGAAAKDIPDILISGAHNPLTPLLGKTTRFAAGETRFHFEPASFAGLQILARYDGQPGSKEEPTTPYTGTPAIWAKPLGRGVLVYAAPSVGATLSWGPTHDLLAEALIQCLSGGRLEPQLVEEGARFGRKQSGLTQAEETARAEAPAPPAFERVTLSSPGGDLPPEVSPIRTKAAPEFNLSGTYHPGEGPAHLLLNHWSALYMVSVDFDGASARLTRTENGDVTDTAEMQLEGLAPIPFQLKERRDRIVLLAGGRRAELSANGLWSGKLGSSGKAVDNLRYQPTEPAFLSDDFMRGEKEQGAWEVAEGEWSVRATGDPKMGANPFTYRGKAQGVGLSVTGLPFWDDYAFEVSTKPTSAGGAVALAFHCPDPSNHLLFRMRVGATADKAHDAVEIVRVVAGQETVLARGDGCLAQGQWYRLAVQVRDGVVTAYVDGRQVATAEDEAFPAGKVALYVRDGEAEFDDVAVRPVGDMAAPTSVELDGTVPRFAGTMDRDTWAGTALQWRAAPLTPGLFWRHGQFWGDFDVTFTCDVGEGPAPPAAMSLLLTTIGGEPDSGYRLTLQPAPHTEPPTSGSYTVELTRQGVSVSQCNVTAGAQPVLELCRVESRLLALVDGREALQYQMPEAPGELARLGFQATGFRPRISGLRLLAGNVLDTCFDHAPVEWWVGSGTWELAARWPCTPEWSWLAGEDENRGVAALWHKLSFAGDVTLDLHVGPRTVDHGDKHPREICRAFNVVLCGDGKDVKSGYSFVVGADKNGTGARLTRNGQVVASEPAYRIFSDAHNQWINVRAEKQGPMICLWVGDQRILSWSDPEPLTGGRLGIWTEDNAIMVPRVTIYHREPATDAP